MQSVHHLRNGEKPRENKLNQIIQKKKQKQTREWETGARTDDHNWIGNWNRGKTLARESQAKPPASSNSSSKAKMMAGMEVKEGTRNWGLPRSRYGEKVCAVGLGHAETKPN